MVSFLNLSLDMQVEICRFAFSFKSNVQFWLCIARCEPFLIIKGHVLKVSTRDLQRWFAVHRSWNIGSSACRWYNNISRLPGAGFTSECNTAAYIDHWSYFTHRNWLHLQFSLLVIYTLILSEIKLAEALEVCTIKVVRLFSIM
jgi:hypothetical protein